MDKSQLEKLLIKSQASLDQSWTRAVDWIEENNIEEISAFLISLAACSKDMALFVRFVNTHESLAQTVYNFTTLGVSEALKRMNEREVERLNG